MVRVVLALVTAFAVATGQAWAACPAPALQTFQNAFDAYGRVQVPLVINGQTVQAAICTTCALSVLGEKFADRANIEKRSRQGGAFAVTPDGVETSLYTEALEIKFGDIPFKRKRQFLVDAGAGDEATIGLDIISFFDMEVDPPAKTLTLHAWNSCGRPAAAWAANAVELPLRTRDFVVYSTIEINGRKVEVQPATSNQSTVMGFATARLHFGISPQSPGVRKTGTMQFTGSDKVHDVYEYRVPELVMSGLTFKDVPLKLIDVENYGTTLGFNELSQLHYTIAFGSKAIYAAPAQ